MTTLRRATGSACWLLGVAAAGLALQRSGTGPLAPPPLAHPEGWGAWLEGRDPVAAALAVVRLGALATVWYLVTATVVGAALRLARAPRLVAVADRLTIPPLRRMLAGTLTMALVASGPGALALGAPAARTRLAAAGQPAPTTTTTAGAGAATTGDPPPTATMHFLPPEAAVQPPAPAASTSPAAVAAPPDRWTVEPGQCFWSIAEAVLSRAWGRPPTDAEIVPYWRRLIDANRGSLAHPRDADLIYPGQVFDVPPV
jgi:nucleoid-associated protein YgaU